LANHKNIFTAGDARAAHGLQASIHRLNKRGFFKTDVVRDGHHPAFGDPRHRTNVLREAATIGIEAGGEAGLFVTGALRVEFSLAVEASAARNVVKAHSAVAPLPFGNAATYRDHGARHFVPQNLRRPHEAMMNLLDVCAADAARRDTNQHFAVGNLRNRHIFHSDGVLPAIDGSPHICGD
jgi:hypothetical protein